MNVSGATGRLVARGTIGRGLRRWSQLWQVPTFLFGVLAILGVAASASYRAELREGPFRDELRSLRKGIRDSSNPSELVSRAEALLAELPRHPRRQGETQFLAGSAYFRLADSAQDDVVARAHAIEHLEAALAIGVPAADLPASHYRLGLSLYRSDADRQRGLELMIQGADRGAERPGQAYALLVEAHLHAEPPDVNAALATSQKMLELADEQEAVGQARYLRAELWLRKRSRLDALKELDRIPNAVSRPLRVKARLLHARVCEDEGQWQRAATTWKDLLGEAADVPGGKGRVLFAWGHCLASAERPDWTGAAAAWQSALEFGGKEAQAAGLRLGELRLHLTPAEPAPALAAWSDALRSIRNRSDWKNPYLDVEAARGVFERGYQKFLDRHDFDHAKQTAELYKKLAAPGVAETRWAQAVEAQARDIQEQAGPAGAPAAALQNKARALFQQAGDAFDRAAQVRSEDDQTEPSWRSAMCYLAANDLPRAAVVLQRFVAQSSNEPRLAEAWFALAQAQAAQGHAEPARKAYYKCMEFPATRYASLARFQLALEEIDRKNFDHAKAILKQNLAADRGNRDREAHEKSLYKLAGLHLLLREYDEAAWHLKEAARQYPNNPLAWTARDRLADCYRMLAEQTQLKIKELETTRMEGISPDRTTALEELRAHQQRTRRQWLEQAVAVYQGITDELQRKAVLRPLTGDEAIILRKAGFGIADRHYEMSNFSEALRQYQILQQVYAKQVEGLIACNSIWRCVNVMVESPSQMKLARDACQNAVRSARADLEAMPADSAAFRGDGVWSKANWITWLDWVANQLNPTATPVSRANLLTN